MALTTDLRLLADTNSTPDEKQGARARIATAEEVKWMASELKWCCPGLGLKMDGVLAELASKWMSGGFDKVVTGAKSGLDRAGLVKRCWVASKRCVIGLLRKATAKKRGGGEKHEQADDRQHAAGQGSDPVARAEADERVEKLNNRLAELKTYNELAHDVLVACLVEGKTQEQVAEEIGQKRHDVRKLLGIAKQFLGDRLGHWEEWL